MSANRWRCACPASRTDRRERKSRLAVARGGFAGSVERLARNQLIALVCPQAFHPVRFQRHMTVVTWTYTLFCTLIFGRTFAVWRDYARFSMQCNGVETI
jgi:hypothetical protein